jgi:hypothetical protein
MRPLIPVVALAMLSAALSAQELRKPRHPLGTVLHPSALATLIDEVGGQLVTLPKARVAAVVNSRVLLVESASLLRPVIDYSRVVVMIDRAELRVRAEEIVDTNVKVLGVARTLVGMQQTREVPWPPELTRDVLKRYEIRAVVLASSVQTADGVELTARVQMER